MTSRSRSRLVSALALCAIVSIVVATVPVSPVAAISEKEVEETCSSSAAAHSRYEQARTQFAQATESLEEANLALAQAESKEERIRGQYESNQNKRRNLKPRAEAQAVDLYMQGVGSGTAELIALDDPEDALVAFELMASTTEGSVAAINDLQATTAELERLGVDLENAVAAKTELRDSRQTLTARQEDAMKSALESYEQLTDECKELQAQYEAEQARLAALRAERRRREAAARERAASRTVNGAICPFSPGRTQFTDSFGAPRSGGRSHRGTDMFAPMGEPIYAVEKGEVDVDDYGLGGKQIFLTASSGRAYYYAHLSGFDVGDGATVIQGERIGFNGNSGNAAGTSPHLHFQIYPNGYGGGIVNPYYTLAEVCF